MPGNRSRVKGRRVEREVTNTFLDAGLHAEKLSWAYKSGADLALMLLNRKRLIEVKSRGDGFKRFYEALKTSDLLILDDGEREPLIAMPLQLALEVFTIANKENT